MAQKKKISMSSSEKRRSLSASKSKKKLGDKLLNWITDTTEGGVILNVQGENLQNKSTGISKESKIGVMKQYVSEGAEKKKEKTPKIIPGISGSSSTITKGKRVTLTKKEEAHKAEVLEEEKTTTEKEILFAPADSAEIDGEKKYDIPSEKIDEKNRTKPEEKTEEIKESGKEDKAISAEKTPVEIGKTYKITEEKERDVSEEEKIGTEDKTPSKKKKTVELAAKEEIPPTEKRKWIKISGIHESLKKGSQELSGTIVKPFKSGKTKLRKSASSIINVSKQPVKSISAFDRKITQSMKKVVSFSDTVIVKNSILKNIKSADSQITKSTKKMIDSILDKLPNINS